MIKRRQNKEKKQNKRAKTGETETYIYIYVYNSTIIYKQEKLLTVIAHLNEKENNSHELSP